MRAEHRAVLLEHVGAARQPRRDHAAGKLLEALAEDLLRLVAGQHALVERDAGQAGLNGGRRNTLGGGFLLEVLEPGFERAGAAGRRERGRCDVSSSAPSVNARMERREVIVSFAPRSIATIDISVETSIECSRARAAKTWPLHHVLRMHCRPDGQFIVNLPSARRCASRWQTAGQQSTGGLVKSSSPARYPCAARETGWPGNRPQACARAARGAEAAAD